jgi:hypothetical protein
MGVGVTGRLVAVAVGPGVSGVGVVIGEAVAVGEGVAVAVVGGAVAVAVAVPSFDASAHPPRTAARTSSNGRSAFVTTVMIS